jgi:hypothetical protein
MEDMLTKKMLLIQSDYVELGKCSLTLDTWAQGLVAF